LIVEITSFLNDMSVFVSRNDMIRSFNNSPNDKQHLPALLELLRIVDAFEPYQINASKRMLNMSILNQGDISRDSYTVAIERIQSIGSILEVLSRDEELADLYTKASNPVHYLQLEQARLGAGVDKAKINAAVQMHESDNKAGVDKAKINADAAVQMHESNNKADVNKAKINANAAIQMNESDNKAGIAKAKIDANTASNNTAGTNTMMTLKVIVAKLSKGVVSDKSNIGKNSMTAANANRRGLPHRPKRGRENDLCKS